MSNELGVSNEVFGPPLVLPHPVDHNIEDVIPRAVGVEETVFVGSSRGPPVRHAAIIFSGLLAKKLGDVLGPVPLVAEGVRLEVGFH